MAYKITNKTQYTQSFSIRDSILIASTKVLSRYSSIEVTDKEFNNISPELKSKTFSWLRLAAADNGPDTAEEISAIAGADTSAAIAAHNTDAGAHSTEFDAKAAKAAAIAAADSAATSAAAATTAATTIAAPDATAIAAADAADQTAAYVEADVDSIATLANANKAEINILVTLANEIKADYNALHADYALAAALANDLQTQFNAAVTLINEMKNKLDGMNL